jgi:hypothetical protein
LDDGFLCCAKPAVKQSVKNSDRIYFFIGLELVNCLNHDL